MTQEQDNIVNQEVALPGATRRMFLRGVIGIAGAALLDSWVTIDNNNEVANQDKDSDNSSQNKQSDTSENENATNYNPITPLIEAYDERITDDDYSKVGTITDSLIFSGSSHILHSLLDNRFVGVNYTGLTNEEVEESNRKYDEMSLQRKVNAASLIVLTVPVLEELIFRGAPTLFSKKESILPVRGLISTYLFGKVHQVKANPTSEDTPQKYHVKINNNQVPLHQYSMGAFFWMQARRKGIAHSILAHSTNNAAALCMNEIKSKLRK